MIKPFVHIIVWLALAYFLFFSLSLFVPVKQAIERALTGTSLMAGMFYISGWILTDQLLIRRKKVAIFIILAFLLCVLFSILRVKLLDLFSSELRGMNLSNLLLKSREDRFLGKNLLLLNRLGAGRPSYFVSFPMNVVILTIALLFRLYEHKSRQEQESLEKLQRSQEAQILYLKSQVNPHFLFNTLNNLYGLTYSKSDLAPQMVLGLSDTMRYMIYETDQKLVPVEKELNFIRNYLDLEKMRISYPGNVRTSIHVSQPSVYIPPLLLLPFIENCFKHGTIGKEEEGWMELDIWDDQEMFCFVCKNSYRERSKSAGNPGIGLTNVKKRLDLIFGEKYELQTVRQNDEFMVSLQFPVFMKKDQL